MHERINAAKVMNCCAAECNLGQKCETFNMDLMLDRAWSMDLMLDRAWSMDLMLDRRIEHGLNAGIFLNCPSTL